MRSIYLHASNIKYYKRVAGKWNVLFEPGYIEAWVMAVDNVIVKCNEMDHDNAPSFKGVTIDNGSEYNHRFWTWEEVSKEEWELINL